MGTPGDPKQYSLASPKRSSSKARGLWFGALFAGLIILVVVAISALGTRSLATEVCDISIIYEQPATAAGAEKWEEFGEKGAELLSKAATEDLQYLGASAQFLAAETRAEVRRGGGMNITFPEMQPWYEVASSNWQNSADTWAELCIEYGAYD